MRLDDLDDDVKDNDTFLSSLSGPAVLYRRV